MTKTLWVKDNDTSKRHTAAGLHWHTDISSPLLWPCYYLRWWIRGRGKLPLIQLSYWRRGRMMLQYSHKTFQWLVVIISLLCEYFTQYSRVRLYFLTRCRRNTTCKLIHQSLEINKALVTNPEEINQTDWMRFTSISINQFSINYQSIINSDHFQISLFNLSHWSSDTDTIGSPQWNKPIFIWLNSSDWINKKSN